MSEFFVVVKSSYLSTLFKKEMGMPLTEYVNRCRVEHAQKLLIGTNMPIKTIAIQCGISDVYCFNRLFKQITGTSPGNYRYTPPTEEDIKAKNTKAKVQSSRNRKNSRTK